jgi:Amidases related to nicotinamidase|tara:strand:- start:2065 stop:2640 length:576 start_codon:yes stop_codon:yes gene_type:complete
LEFISKNPALIIIDVQKAFLEKDYPGIKRNNTNAELVCGNILNKWRKNDLNVIHVRHSSTNPESKLHKSKPGFEFNDYVKPKNNEIVLTKNVNSAFIGTGLDEILKNLNINTLVIVGMTTNHCISTTVRMAGNLGYETFLISDSTACYNTKGLDGKEIDCEIIYEASIASLSGEFAEIISSRELFELLNDR